MGAAMGHALLALWQHGSQHSSLPCKRAVNQARPPAFPLSNTPQGRAPFWAAALEPAG